MERETNKQPEWMQAESLSKDFPQMWKVNAKNTPEFGPLTLVPLDKEPTLDNIKAACKAHFGTSLDCDVLSRMETIIYRGQSNQELESDPDEIPVEALKVDPEMLAEMLYGLFEKIWREEEEIPSE